MDIRFDRIETGIVKYSQIMELLYSTDVSTDKEFQRIFNGFYRLRQRPTSFYATYYGYMEQQKKNKTLEFRDVLQYLYDETGVLYPSFSSKLLATINPNKPIWDKFVLQNLGLKAPYTYAKNRIEKTVHVYEEICRWYETKEAEECLLVFDQHFPDVEMTNVKKVDWILWGQQNQ